MYAFIVTNMDSSPEYLIKFYSKRGLKENFIKVSKSGFDFSSVSSHTRIVNANILQVHALVYNIFNWFRLYIPLPQGSSAIVRFLLPMKLFL